MDKALYSADGISTELVQSKKITQEEKRTRGRAIFATSLGHGLEYFDFTLYSYFAPTIGKLFFPAQGELVQLMLSLATFGIAYIARPLGSILIGSYADRAGRKPALMLTISLMAAGTAIIGLTPAYETIGILAPSLLVLGRLLQGVSAGGEAGASTAFLMESGGLRSRGFAVSWQAASQAGAALASACCVFMLAKSMDSEALASWGWRLPFLAGLLIGPLGFYLRRHLDDTLPVDNRSHEPATRILLQNWPKVLCAAMVVIGGTATTYTMFFLSSFSQITLHFSTAETSIVSGCVAVSVLFVAPLAGILTDRLLAPFACDATGRFKRRKTVLALAHSISVIAIFPLFWFIERQPSIFSLTLTGTIMIWLVVVATPSGYLQVLEAFPPHARATSLAVINAIGVTLFGGFGPMIVAGLYKHSGSFYSPAWYVAVCNLIAIAGALLFPAITRSGNKT